MPVKTKTKSANGRPSDALIVPKTQSDLTFVLIKYWGEHFNDGYMIDSIESKMKDYCEKEIRKGVKSNENIRFAGTINIRGEAEVICLDERRHRNFLEGVSASIFLVKKPGDEVERGEVKKFILNESVKYFIARLNRVLFFNKVNNDRREVAFKDIKQISLSANEVMRLLGIKDLETIFAMVKDRQLIALADSGEFYFPRWQFDEAQKTIVDGLIDVLNVLPLADFGKILWLTNKNYHLGGISPVDCLKTKGVGPVVLAAKSLGGV